ncbi:MAG: cupredoxin domain-containing protein [Dehalococcoidales bacterium]|nr:cupredoxin domain-containing protein [Dehalococcoidales bacterium]
MITDQGIDPVVLTVPAGTKVTWHNMDSRVNSRHWMKALDGSFSTQAIPRTTRMSVTFNTPGTYDYRCIYHKDIENEMGTIIVTE